MALVIFKEVRIVTKENIVQKIAVHYYLSNLSSYMSITSFGVNDIRKSLPLKTSRNRHIFILLVETSKAMMYRPYFI